MMLKMQINKMKTKVIIFSVLLSNTFTSIVLYLQFGFEINFIAIYFLSLIYYSVINFVIIFIIIKKYPYSSYSKKVLSFFLNKFIKVVSVVLAIILVIISFFYNIANDMFIYLSWLIMFSITIMLLERKIYNAPLRNNSDDNLDEK